MVLVWLWVIMGSSMVNISGFRAVLGGSRVGVCGSRVAVGDSKWFWVVLC